MRLVLLFPILHRDVQKVRSGTKSVTVKTGRRAGVGSAAKRLEEPNSFFIGGVGFLQHGTSVLGFLISSGVVTGSYYARLSPDFADTFRYFLLFYDLQTPGQFLTRFLLLIS